MFEITQVTTVSDVIDSLEVILRSFNTVAVELNLTSENAPTHSAFTTLERLQDLHKKAAFFALHVDGSQVGFVAVEKGQGDVYYLDKLAVLPDHRHRGYGTKLVNYVFDYLRGNNGKTVALGMIDSMMGLKKWYKRLGFKETGTKKFEHLPFLVCFMEKELSA
jgi:ribosomal protein S18 acetylase RimI-like enzyme